MNALTPQQTARLDAYLDGSLSTADRADFEREAERSPALQEALRVQREIDASLGRLFSPEPMASAPPAPIPFPSAQKAAPRLRQFGLLAAAAVLALVFGIRFVNQQTNRPPQIAPDVLMQRLVTTGFVPKVVCTTQEEFADLVRNRFGEAVVLSSAATGVELVGWAYGDDPYGSPISENTLILMARSGGEPVVVLMDHASADREVKVKSDTGIQVFRRRIGGLVTYEITRASQAEILPHLEPRAAAGGCSTQEPGAEPTVPPGDAAPPPPQP